MKKLYVSIIILLVLALGFVLGCCYKCCAHKVAVVDLAAVVSNSEQVKALQSEQNVKSQEISLWLKNAQTEIDAQKDEQKKAALVQQYNAAFNQKRDEIAQQYAQSLQNIDASITQTIIDEAKKKGYKMVFAKGVTIFGGDDITADVAKVVK